MALQNRSTQEIARYITTELDPERTLTGNENPYTIWYELNQLWLDAWDRPEGIEITEAELAEYIFGLRAAAYRDSVCHHLDMRLDGKGNLVCASCGKVEPE